MPEPFQERYTADQRRALATAYEDRRIRPYRVVCELAAAGELEPGMPPFEVTGGPGYVADLVRKLRRTRAGEHTSELAKAPPRDAIEALRRRLVNVCDQTLNAIEREKPRDRDPERLRQLARAIREAAAIPGPTDPTPLRPGHGKPAPGERKGEGATRGGIAGGVLAQAHRDGGGGPINARDEQPAPGEQSRETDDGEREGAAHDHAARHDQTTETEQPSPGEWARAEIAQLVGGEESARG